jgi:hypothetical protein
LGKLSCDLGGKGKIFSKIVKATWAATKGPYALVYTNPGKSELLEKVRIKGIPHSNEPFLHSESNVVNIDHLEEEKRKEIIQFVDRPFDYRVPTDVIGKKFYMFVDSDGGASFTKHINIDLIQKIMQKEGM